MGKPQSQTVTNKYEMSPEQRQLLEPTIPIALDYLHNPPTLPNYSQIAGFNQNQLGAQQSLLGSVLPQQQIASGAAASNQFLMDPRILNASSNPALQSYIDAATRPIQQNLMETVLPQLRGEAVTAGQYGSSRQGIAEGLASGRAFQAMGDTTANIANQGYQSGLEAMARGQALAPQTSQLQTLPGLTQGAVGDVQHALSQAQLSEQAYRDLYKQIAPFLAAQEVAGMAQGFPGGSATSTTTGGGGGGIGGALSGGLGGLSLGASLGMGPFGAIGGGILGLLGSLI